MTAPAFHIGLGIGALIASVAYDRAPLVATAAACCYIAAALYAHTETNRKGRT